LFSKDEFNTWLNCEKELISRLDESEIDMSCKSDLFDVLDAETRDVTPEKHWAGFFERCLNMTINTSTYHERNTKSAGDAWGPP
jgi:hypothetical protein